MTTQDTTFQCDREEQECAANGAKREPEGRRPLSRILYAFLAPGSFRRLAAPADTPE
jgi:hypothetical protein